VTTSGPIVTAEVTTVDDQVHIEATGGPVMPGRTVQVDGTDREATENQFVDAWNSEFSLDPALTHDQFEFVDRQLRG
jgi:hypothetical protein